MGIGTWFRRFVAKVQDLLGMRCKYDDYRADAYFPDGGSMTYVGRPWGGAFEQFKAIARDEAVSVTMNMTGSFWRFQ